ncbi:MAG: amino acid permease [Rhodospirillaceae bacterium]|nr:amino acid permease [Rhodospirillaceae bacterium]MBT5374570.1 amino acid permease [Rhodospirillaceae bacterium]MBT5752085.1 amino acid permease [Rhodospirillaceae bacterium]
MKEEASLKRALSLSVLVLYGLGTTVGAGIYALLGKIVGRAGMYAPLSFLLASFLAAFTALSFAELSSRHPKSAGEAVYVLKGFRIAFLSQAVGLAVVLAGTVSAAAILNGAVGYVQSFVAVPGPGLIVFLVFCIAAIAAWGIRESVGIAALFTLIEIGGLLIVIWAGREGFLDLPQRWPEIMPPFEWVGWSGILTGAFLAFYAFLGFEDIVNVAEEVKGPSITLPRAIILTLAITTLLYVLIALTAVLNLAPSQLAESGAPLSLLYQQVTGGSPALIGLISIFAILNGALIQMVMASRILYGMGKQGLLPKVLAHIHPLTRTPLWATAAVAGLLLVMALGFDMVSLADATSAITLSVFTLVNLSLIMIKRRDPRPVEARIFPMWVPVIGFSFSLAFLAQEIATRFLA